jgi:hypothetical protein
LRYNRGKSVALDRSAPVEAGGGRKPPRDAAATAIDRGKVSDILGGRSLPGSLPQGRDGPIQKALTKNSSLGLKPAGRRYAEHFTEAKTSPAALYLVADP